MRGQIGSGSLPVESLPSAGLVIAPAAAKGKGRALDELSAALRGLPVPVIGRIAEDQLWLDLRCLDRDEQLTGQLSALAAALGCSP